MQVSWDVDTPGTLDYAVLPSVSTTGTLEKSVFR